MSASSLHQRKGAFCWAVTGPRERVGMYEVIVGTKSTAAT